MGRTRPERGAVAGARRDCRRSDRRTERRDVRRDGLSNVLVDVATPDSREVSLFVEGPTPDWALPIPTPVEPATPGMRRFKFELDGLPPGAKPKGAALKLTLVGAERSYEFNINLN